MTIGGEELNNLKNTNTDWAFSLSNEEDPQPIPVGDEELPWDVIPYVYDADAWKQFTDPVVYQIDKVLREFMTVMSRSDYWRKHTLVRKYTCGMLWKLLFKRPYDRRIDTTNVKKAVKIFAYYSSTVTKEGTVWDDETQSKRYFHKTVYTLSSKAIERPPYSLRLRWEWLSEKGVVPDKGNMKLPKDDLKPGHSRYPKTEARLQERREKAREAYNEYQRNRKEALRRIEAGVECEQPGQLSD